MRKSPQRESTHILISSDEDCDELMDAASSGERVLWIVPKKARAGDRVIFFHRSKGLLAA